MIKKAIRTAATVAALAILVGLTTPVASQAAAPVRNQTVGVEGEQAASPAELWQTLTDFWEGLVASVFAGSEGEGGSEEATAAPPPEGGENNNSTDDDDGDAGPVIDPTG